MNRVSRFAALMYIFHVTVICIPIQNNINQIRHVQQHYETLSVVNILIILLTLYDLQYMTIYNVCCLLLEYYTKVFSNISYSCYQSNMNR